MTTHTAAPAADFAAIVGVDYVKPAAPADVILGCAPRWVIAPGSPEEVAAVLRAATAAGLRIAPRGGGSKLGWGNPPAALDAILSLHRLDRVLEHAWGDMTATVEAGCLVASLQQTLADHGQRLALDPLWPQRATVGGILATNDSGALRIRFGTLRDQVIGLLVALPDGTLARSGGKVVKNVAGYDLPKLFTGAFGTLGVIIEATFRLYPLPDQTVACTVAAPTVAPLQALLLRVLDTAIVPTGLQLRAAGQEAALDLRFEGTAAACTAQLDTVRRLAGDLPCPTADPAVWTAHERLWTGADPAVIARSSVLPADLAYLCASAAAGLPTGGAWQLVAQGTGGGLLRLAAPTAEDLPAAVTALRAAIAATDGSLVVLDCPTVIRPQIDVWGPPGAALPLMRRIKAQFDPTGTLNPGRFIGGL
ncbi:MAG: FAD-binding oxidoreductase [Chloroflexota bacterium]|nr:FAD-binding oxidoreductase [Chloroflexota bacterium]